jgi:hypothetical protein
MGRFSQEDLRRVVINMPSKEFGPLTKSKRDALASKPRELRVAMLTSYPMQIGEWVRRVELQMKHLDRQAGAEADGEEKTMAEQLKTEHNEVFEFQLHHSMAGSRSPLGDQDDMKRYLVLIKADNSDADAVMAGLPKGVQFSVVKGSMNFGLNMFEGDSEHTSAEELGKLMEWLAVNNEDTPCSVFLGCLPDHMATVKETLVDKFCNAGAEYCVWYKPYKFVKNPVKGLGHDLEFRVVGWRSPNGKLLDQFFRKPNERSRVTNFPPCNKLRSKETGKMYCAAEETPLVRTRHTRYHSSECTVVVRVVHITRFWAAKK